MMKTKLSTVLMLAMMVVSVGFLGSCKDYDDDVRTEFNIKNASLKEYVDAKIADLQAQIDALKAAQWTCDCDCEARLAALDAAVAALQAKDAELQNAINNKADKAVVEVLQNDVNTLKTKVNTLINDVADIKTAITTINNNITTLQNLYNDLKTTVDSHDTQITDLTNRVTTIETTLIQVNASLTELTNQVNLNKEAIENINTVITTIQNDITIMKGNIATALENAAAALEKANQNYIFIQELQNLYNELGDKINNYINTNDARLDDIEERLNNLKECACNLDEITNHVLEVINTTVLINYYTKEDIDDKLDDIIDDVTELLNDYVLVDDFNTYKDEVQTKFDEIQTKLDELTEKFDNYYTKEEVDIKVDELWNEVNELWQNYAILQETVGILAGRIEENALAIEKNAQDIADLTGRVSALENAMNELITGIIIQATENPIFGSFALPMNVQSNVLIGYFGHPDQDGAFPVEANGYEPNYIWAEQALTPAELAMIGSTDAYTFKSGSWVVSDADDNAGKLYVTINPAEVDVTGATISIENSQGTPAGLKLSPLVKSDRKLSFGYTRAQNGFYECNAKLTSEALANGEVRRVHFDAGKIKDIASDILKNKQHFNVTSAARTIYEQMNDMLDANAVKTTYTNWDGAPRSVYSNYNLAATAVKPLSFGFLKDYYGRSTLPGYERIENLIDRVANKVHRKFNALWPDLPSEVSVHVKRIDVDAFDDIDNVQTISIDFSMDFFAQYGRIVQIGDDYWLEVYADAALTDLLYRVRFESDDATITQSAENPDVYVLTMTKEESVDFTEIINLIKDTFEDVDKTYDDLEDLIADVNKALEEVDKIHSSLNNTIDSAFDVIRDVLDKVNDLGIRAINSIIARMQPCLLLDKGSGVYYTTNLFSNPMLVDNGNIAFLATTGNAEYLTPCLKKFVACVEVRKNGASAQAGDADCRAELQRVNAQEELNTILDGSRRRVHAQLKSGYTYQFAYSALDYSGQVAVKRAVIRVK